MFEMSWKKKKQNLLIRNISNYNIDVCHLHETKIKGLYNNILIREQKLIALETDSKYSGHCLQYQMWQENPWTLDEQRIE